MLLEHSFVAIISSTALSEPLAILSILREGDAPRTDHTPGAFLGGLDPLPATVSIEHARQLPEAILAVVLANATTGLARTFWWPAPKRTRINEFPYGVELEALAQHITFGNLVPFRESLTSTRSMTSLQSIAKNPAASAAVYSADGAPVLVVETGGGVAALATLSACERLRLMTIRPHLRQSMDIPFLRAA